MNKRKYFNILSFPKFVMHVDEIKVFNPDDMRYDRYDTAMIADGFTSAQFDPKLTWSMSEDEFTWFVLKWS